MTKRSLDISRRQAMLVAGSAALGVAANNVSVSGAQAKAALMGTSKPSHFRFKLGNFEITTLNDGAFALPGPHPIFGQNIPAKDVRDLAEKNFLPREKFEISFTPVIINTGSEVIMFDTGNGAARRPKAGLLKAQLALAGYKASDIDIVVITHFHPDHIGGLMEDGKPLFSNARYVTGAVENNFWTHADRMNGPAAGLAKLVNANVKPLAPKTSFINPGADVVSGITSIESFGHTPGHMAYNIESGGRRLVLIADTCNHHVVSMQRPDWHVKFDAIKDKAAASRKRVLGMIAADKIPFVGYHMPFPAVGYIEPMGQGFRYEAASYQINL